MPTPPLFNPPASIDDAVTIERLQTALASLLQQGERFTESED